MTSQKQIEANCRNAQRSTGPKTVQGKAVVARNACQHGILSSQVPVDDGERDLYCGFRESMVRELGPRGELESLLVDRIVSTAWRLRRVVHVETLIMRKAQEASYGSWTYKDAFEGNSAGHMAVLSRYEKSLENALFRAMKEFRELHGEQELDLCEIPI